MDTALFLTLFLFAVQIAAGVAPLIWPNPQHAWIARSIFWSSGLFAVVCMVIWAQPMSFVSPNYLIAFGLVIAACGFVWQQTKLASKPEAVGLAVEAASQSPAPLEKRFTAYDIEQRNRAIDELYGLLSTEVLSASTAGARLNKSLMDRILNKTAAANLSAYADTTEIALNKYFDAAGRYMIFPDIHHDATALVWNPFEAVSSAKNLAAEIKSLEQQDANVPLYLKSNKFMAEFNTATSGRFWTWINEKQQLLTKKRREYEAAPIYPK
jgi:hypothetical protein